MFKHYLFHNLALLMPSRRLRSNLRSKFPKPIEKMESIKNFLMQSVDITKLPPARGHIRLLQRANMKLVMAFDKMCRENGIEYMMGGGALIGKLRHDGWIPWDDDIDLHVVGENWDKLVKLFQEKYPNDEFYLVFNGFWHNLFKLIHRKTGVELDIFRFEFYSSDIENNAQDFDKITKLKKAYSNAVAVTDTKRNTRQISFRHSNSPKELAEKWQEYNNRMTKYDKIWNKKMMAGAKSSKKGAIISTSSFQNYILRDFHKNDTVYPIQILEFDGVKLPFPNNIEMWTAHLYGDIYTYPPDMFARHTGNRIDFIRYVELKKLIEMSDKEVYKQMTGKKS